MDKTRLLKFLKHDHRKLVQILAELNEHQMVNTIIIGSWTVKDIIAHISAWNWEIIKAVHEVLSDKKPWYIDKTEEEFNNQEIKKRESWSLNRILKEWQDSFNNLILSIEGLSVSEWNHQSSFLWPDGQTVSIKSLFDYRYRGEGHEGGHAIQIREVINQV
ncbi:MAG: DinB family protein [Candidatus Hermodarchaeota archaeon]